MDRVNGWAILTGEGEVGRDGRMRIVLVMMVVGCMERGPEDVHEVMCERIEECGVPFPQTTIEEGTFESCVEYEREQLRPEQPEACARDLQEASCHELLYGPPESCT